MKKSIFIAAAFAAISLVSCKKTDATATEANPNADPNAAAVVVDNDKMPITNDSTINKIDNKMEGAVDATGNAIKEGANATGDAIKTGANDVKNAAHNATDGDGHPTK